MPRQYTPGPLPFLPFTQVELTCEQCGARFLVAKKAVRTRRFCTRACGYANKRTLVEQTCHECGLPMPIGNGSQARHRACYDAMRRRRSVETALARIWARVDKNGPLPERRPELGRCWISSLGLWRGYSSVSVAGVTTAAYRVVYESVNGPIPDGLYLDHLCRTPACVRPDHLEAVTNRENILRGDTSGALALRTGQCKHGHAFSPENTIARADGHRACRECMNAAQRRAYRRKRAASVHQ